MLPRNKHFFIQSYLNHIIYHHEKTTAPAAVILTGRIFHPHKNKQTAVVAVNEDSLFLVKWNTAVSVPIVAEEVVL